MIQNISYIYLVLILYSSYVVIVFSLTGKFNDIYHDYKYTYITCGICLLVASMFLFICMGINYRLLDKEAKAEARKSHLKGKEKESTIDIADKETAAALQVNRDAKTAEDTV